MGTTVVFQLKNRSSVDDLILRKDKTLHSELE